MSNTINIDEMADKIIEGLKIFKSDIVIGINEEGMKVAKSAIKRLGETSPKKTNVYSKGWKIKKIKNSDESITYSIYNKNKPQIAHLLENGYNLPMGYQRRTGGRAVEAKPHIKAVEILAINEFTNGVEEVIRNYDR